MKSNCEELQPRLLALHRANLGFITDISLKTLLKQIANVAKEQANAERAAVGLLNGKGKIVDFISVGDGEPYFSQIPEHPQGEGLLGALTDTADPIRVPSLSADTRCIGFLKDHPEVQSFMGVPIWAGGKQLGQLYLGNKLDAPEFSAEDEQIILMLAGYAAAAIQNAQLYTNLRDRDVALTQRSEDLTLINNIAAVLAPAQGIDNILSRTLELVMNYLGVEAGEIFLLEETSQILRMVLHRGEAAEAFWTKNEFQLDEGFVGITATQKKALVSTNLPKDMRYLRSAVVEAGFKQFACFPLTSGEKTIGVLGAAKMGDIPFDKRSIQLLTAVGKWAGMAIHNARLNTDERRLAVLEERERIGMDMHDGVIQSVFGVGLGLENARLLIDENPEKAKQSVRLAIDGLNQAIRDLRTYILDLRPRQLGDENLLFGLHRLLTEYRVNTLSEAILTGKEEDFEFMNKDKALIFFHICQEALANTAKHARAKRVTVTLWTTQDRYLMEVEDNGKGFALDKMSMTLGHGLSNMHTRIRKAGGEVDITSAPSEGTLIQAWLPRINRG